LWILTEHMDPIRRIANHFSRRSRQDRARLFRDFFHIDGSTRILDIGSEDGRNIFGVLEGSSYDAGNVCIADIDEAAIKRGRQQYGFEAVVIDESAGLPFADYAFDIVYCSSVIEHVTVRQEKVWDVTSGREFRRAALERQRQFAREIRRVGKQYFVQTPAAGFPIESHTWLPGAGYLPRRLLVPLVKFTNQWWPKKSQPDFNLLRFNEMNDLFPDSVIVRERKFGLTKSFMAINSYNRRDPRA
jgi:SAM-dependent methyltransferase